MTEQNKKIRIGTGFDFHPFQTGGKLVLGGVEIRSSLGLRGHSDADAVIHAVCDALLGALGDCDIGTLFPNDNDLFKNISSLKLLEKVTDRVHARGYQVGNVDITVIAEVPKIQPYADQMKRTVAEILGVKESDIGIKATTMEKLGTIGRKEGLAAQAVALLYPAD